MGTEISIGKYNNKISENFGTPVYVHIMYNNIKIANCPLIKKVRMCGALKANRCIPDAKKLKNKVSVITLEQM